MRKSLDQAGDGPLQMVELAIEIRIVTPILDHPARMGDGGAISFEEDADFGQGGSESDVSEIHGDLPRERRSRRTSGRRAKILDVDLEDGRDGGLDRPPDRACSAPGRGRGLS